MLLVKQILSAVEWPFAKVAHLLFLCVRNDSLTFNEVVRDTFPNFAQEIELGNNSEER